MTDPLSPEEIDRYRRHIVLAEIGGAGQQKLKQANVLIVGAGGLGAPVIQYLAAAPHRRSQRARYAAGSGRSLRD